MKNNLGHQVRRYRRQRGLTQAELAHRMGVHRVYVSRIESGRVGVSAATLVRLAEALGVSLDALAAPLYVQGAAER